MSYCDNYLNLIDISTKTFAFLLLDRIIVGKCMIHPYQTTFWLEYECIDQIYYLRREGLKYQQYIVTSLHDFATAFDSFERHTDAVFQKRSFDL